MADAVGAESSGRHEQVVELRKEASTMALYVAICLLAAFAALPETDAHARVIAIIWGGTVGLALAHWLAFRVSARMVGREAFASRCGVGRGPAGGGRGGDGARLHSGGLVSRVGRAGAGGVVAGRVHRGCWFAVARGGGATRARAMVYALAVLVIAVAIALVKNGLAGH